jgi:hypothetical protein
MEFLKETHFIERLQFFNGQRLFASDLQGLEAFNREMRWLHNQSLHQPGIGNGFAVAGKKGDREVTIGPGYAIDAEGREIVLTQSQVEPIPPVAGEPDGSPTLYDLTVSYPDDAFLEETERREGICRQPGGTIRLKEEPIFCWIRLNEDGQPQETKQKQEILAGMRIVLARAEVLNCQLNKDISIAQRLSARPPKQPYICCREVAPEWRSWMIAPFNPVQLLNSDTGRSFAAQIVRSLAFFPIILPFGLQAEIDTAQCGFLTTPCYSARISGLRIKPFTLPDNPNDTAGSQDFSFTFLVDGLVQIVNPLPNKFTAQVLLIAQLLFPETERTNVTLFSLEGSESKFVFLPDADALTNLAERLKSVNIEAKIQQIIDQLFSDWQLVWMGVEG